MQTTANFSDVAGYERLHRILELAYDRASSGKGQQRHNILLDDFEHQPIIEINRRLQSNSGMLYQIIKKTYESVNLPSEQAINELLDVIVYAAAAIIHIQNEDLHT